MPRQMLICLRAQTPREVHVLLRATKVVGAMPPHPRNPKHTLSRPEDGDGQCLRLLTYLSYANYYEPKDQNVNYSSQLYHDILIDANIIQRPRQGCL